MELLMTQFENHVLDCRGYQWDKDLGLSDATQGIDI